MILSLLPKLSVDQAVDFFRELWLYDEICILNTKQVLSTKLLYGICDWVCQFLVEKQLVLEYTEYVC